MGAAQRYNEQQLEQIKKDLKWMIHWEIISVTAIFAVLSFIILTYSFRPEPTIASIALGITYGADVSLASLNSIIRYFG